MHRKYLKKRLINLRKKTAMVFQNYSLLKNKTALQNVMEPMVVIQKIKKNEAEKIALSLLEKVGMLEKKDALSKGIIWRTTAKGGNCKSYGNSSRINFIR